MNQKTDPAKAENDDARRQDGAEHQETNVEARARRLGWKSQEEFDALPAANRRGEWKPAEQYIEYVESQLPVMRERVRYFDRELEKRDRELGTVKQQLEQTTQVLAEFGEYNKKIADQAYERARADIKAEIEEATKAADVPAAQAAMARLDALDKDRPKLPSVPEPAKPAGDASADDKPAGSERPAPKISPTAQAWIRDNSRIMSDAVLNPIAVEIHGQNLQAGMSEADSFAGLVDQVRERAPWKFENQRRSAPGAVTPPSPPPARKKPGVKTYDDLPDDAKQQCDRFVASIKGFTREQYLADYKW